MTSERTTSGPPDGHAIPAGARVLVTGAASGLGAALVSLLRARGAEVLATDARAAHGWESADAADPVVRRLDITSDDDWAAAAAWVERTWGGLDVLVNNAGIAGGGRIDQCTLEEWDWIFQVNLYGAVRGIRTFTPVFKRQRSGRVVDVASLAALVHPAGMASYNAVKAALLALTETVGHELASYGVQAHAVCPSYFRTNLMESLKGTDEAVGQVMRELVTQAPLGAEEIAEAVLAGIEAGEELILPDPAAQAAYELRTTDRATYDQVMRAQARKLDAMAGAAPPATPPATPPASERATHRASRRRRRTVTNQPEGSREVRDEDAFDVEAVTAWLRQHTSPEDAQILEGTPQVRQFSGGASNLTYLLRFPGRDLILRRAPRGTKARGAHDMSREYRIQSALEPVFPYVAHMVGFCDDESVIGADFYVMDRIDGIIPRADMPPGLEVSPEQARGMCLSMVDVLAELHAIDPAAAGLESIGKGHGYVRRQVEGWSTRMRNAMTDDAPDFEQVMAWLDERQPDDVATCVIHNDFKMDNVVFAPDDVTRIVGVLDWEMATLGDPLMDLGGNLAYWVEAGDKEFEAFRRVPTHLPGMLTRWEFVQAYCERTGLEVTRDQWAFYEVYGYFRSAVIAQQIYYRYFHGQTSNELFSIFGPAVHLMRERIVSMLR